MMTDTTGYNKFVDDEIYGQVQKAANPANDEKPIQTKDIASTVMFIKYWRQVIWQQDSFW